MTYDDSIALLVEEALAWREHERAGADEEHDPAAYERACLRLYEARRRTDEAQLLLRVGG